MQIEEWVTSGGKLADVYAGHGVEIELSENGGKIHVNVDGVCVARIAVKPGVLIKLSDPTRGKHAGYKRVAKNAGAKPT